MSAIKKSTCNKTQINQSSVKACQLMVHYLSKIEIIIPMIIVKNLVRINYNN